MSTWRDWPTIEEQRTAMGTPDRPTYDAHLRRPDAPPPVITPVPTARIADEIPPRVRVNVKRLANGQWQPDITVESFDADPYTTEGRFLIRERLDSARAIVGQLLGEWNAADRLNGTGGACDDRR